MFRMINSLKELLRNKPLMRKTREVLRRTDDMYQGYVELQYPHVPADLSFFPSFSGVEVDLDRMSHILEMGPSEVVGDMETTQADLLPMPVCLCLLPSFPFTSYCELKCMHEMHRHK
jgi:hypothetical protein